MSRRVSRRLGVEALEPRLALSNFFVSTTGDDGSPGTAASPWRTLQHAADSVRPGDVVTVRAGTYTGFDLTTDGTATNRIVFQAEPGVLINAKHPSVSAFHGVINLEGADHVTIDGFNVTLATYGQARANIRSVENTGVVIRNNTIDNASWWGVLTGNSASLLVEGNRITNTQVQHGIYIGNSADNPVVRGNIVANSRGAGIQINADRDLPGDGVISNALVEGNTLLNNARGEGSSLNLNGLEDGRIINNLIASQYRNGIAMYQDNQTAGTKRNLVANNTIVGPAWYAVSISGSGSTDNRIFNNVLFSQAWDSGFRGGLGVENITGLQSDHNTLIGRVNRDPSDTESPSETASQWRARGFDTHSIFLEETYDSGPAALSALFVGPPDWPLYSPEEGDYHLKTGSPAINAGVEVAGVVTDLEGRPRDNRPDIGAFEVAIATPPPPRPVVQVVDDGDAAFARSGAWESYFGLGHLNDLSYTLAGSANDVATWTFAVSPGRYRVSATWLERPNRSAGAPYAILDGATQVGSAAIDQRVAPDDFTAAGSAWEDLGTVSVGGTSLAVRLSGAAPAGYLIADAVRVERVGDLSQAPEIEVLDGGTNVADGTGSVAFGTVTVGSPASKTFTVRNTGTADLTLGPTISVPAGFTVTAGFGSATLAPGASTTFTVRLDAAAAGSYSGEVSFANNDADESPFNFAVTGTVNSPAPPSSVQIVDDGQSGFSATGGWASYTGLGRDNDFTYAPTGSGAQVATWTFAVSPGRYRVSATWVARPNRAPDAPYAILDGATPVGSASVDQRSAPDDFTAAGSAWEDLAANVAVSGGSLVVRLTDAAGGQYVIADAVRVERVGDLSQAPEIEVLDGGTNVADGTGNVSFGTVTVGSPASKTFTVRNTGTADLTLGPTISVPAGFTVTAGFGSATLAPGASTTFTVRLDAAAEGSYTGEVSFANNDADESPFNFAVSGTVTAPPPPQIIDDGDAGFSTTGTWESYQSLGHGGDFTYSLSGTGADVAAWTFAVTSGQYRVSATWVARPNRASDAPYTILDGATALATARVDQRQAPDDFTEGSTAWEDLGTVRVSGTSLVVRLSDGAGPEYVIADAIRIQRIGD